MNYSVQDIIRDVRTTLDENEVSVFLMDTGDTDTLSLDTIIGQKILHAVRSIIEAAPARLLEGGVRFAGKVYWEKIKGKGMGYALLPDDFMRLLKFQMSDWRRPVLDAIDDRDEMYFIQRSKFPGIRGGVDRPVCAITTYPIGKVMEFYSCNGGDSVFVKDARYLPFPELNEDGTIDFSKPLYLPVIYYTAALVATTYEDQEHANRLFTFANDYIK